MEVIDLSVSDPQRFRRRRRVTGNAEHPGGGNCGVGGGGFLPGNTCARGGKSWTVTMGSEHVAEHFREPGVIHATVNHPETGKQIAVAQFRVKDGGEVYPESVHVKEEYRRQGIASAIYDHVRGLGYTIQRQPALSTEGKKFRAAYEKRKDDAPHGLSPAAERYREAAWHNGGGGRKAGADLPPARLARLVRSYAGQVLAAERAGEHGVAAELVHAAPGLIPGARVLGHAGAVEPYDGGRHEGALGGHRGDVRVLRPGLEFPPPRRRGVLGAGGYAVVIRARAEPT